MTRTRQPLNPMYWWAIHAFERERRRLIDDDVPADRARYLATAKVVLHGPWDPAVAQGWIDAHLS